MPAYILLPTEGNRNKFLVWAVASILSLVTVSTLLALCRTSQRRLNSGAAVQRRLSDTEDAHDRSDLLEQCLDLEQELGLHPAVSEYVEEASEAKSRLVAMLYDSAVNFERMRAVAPQMLQDEAQPPPPKIPRLNESSPSTSHSGASFGAFWQRRSFAAVGGVVSALDPDAWLPGDSGAQQSQTAKLEDLLGLQWDTSAPPVGPSAVYKGKAADIPPAASLFGRAHSGVNALVPGAWLDDEGFQKRIVSTTSRHATRGATSEASISAVSVAAPNERKGRVDPRTPTAGGAGGGGPPEDGDIRLHPFVRLPVINPQHIHRCFRKEFALSFGLWVHDPMKAYTTMRSLFAKASLTAQDVETLMTEAEILANYAVHKLAGPCKDSTSYLLVKLSSLFMVFDYLVCAIELLGEKMDTGNWWNEFAQKFRTDYRLPEAARTQRATFLNQLVNRLSSALAIYKGRRRPNFREIIELKRTILAEANAETQLGNPQWKLWIQDDKEFSSSNSYPKPQSDVRTPDERGRKLL
ncbi:uncharacterized protein EMH_0036440 [Eimeria mitis]|uniref:Uncharacterized protein n=1 Tax=Eimeria mitis TaxID=44415 RepID=U6JV79_9EIME|nr:uncharacterized protein EMH_0036440 [Eimeria mitis]CDJ27967.1 hypothetical protein EMH_0036440 [Eimeria mitis]